MNNKQTVVCYLKDEAEVSTWNVLLSNYPCLTKTIKFVAFNGNDKYDIAINVANAIAQNSNLVPYINFVAIFNSNIDGISNLDLIKDMMFRSNPERKENIHVILLKSLWVGKYLPELNQIDNHNLHYDNLGVEHNDFVNDYSKDSSNFKRANQVFKTLLITYLKIIWLIQHYF